MDSERRQTDLKRDLVQSKGVRALHTEGSIVALGWGGGADCR